MSGCNWRTVPWAWIVNFHQRALGSDLMQFRRTVELDLVRFCAAVSVLVYHYVAWFSSDNPQQSLLLDTIAPWTQFGFLGVPLFFMVSGYVILNSALHRTPTEFAKLRSIRLFPVYWFCVAVTSLVVIFLPLPSGTKPVAISLDITTFLMNLTMLQDYMGINSIDGVYWTLFRELQFYVCMFVLMWTGVIHRVRVWLTAWLVLTLCFMIFRQPSFFGIFISPEYSPFFIGGVACSLIRKDGPNDFNSIVLLVSMAMSCHSIALLNSSFMPVPVASADAICQCVVVLFYLVFVLISYQWINIKPVGWIAMLGGITYPLYLIHNLVAKSIMIRIVNTMGPVSIILAATCTSLCVAWLIHKYFEQPVGAFLKRLLIRPKVAAR